VERCAANQSPIARDGLPGILAVKSLDEPGRYGRNWQDQALPGATSPSRRLLGPPPLLVAQAVALGFGQQVPMVGLVVGDKEDQAGLGLDDLMAFGRGE
jgi:hypothetical protein